MARNTRYEHVPEDGLLYAANRNSVGPSAAVGEGTAFLGLSKKTSKIVGLSIAALIAASAGVGAYFIADEFMKPEYKKPTPPPPRPCNSPFGSFNGCVGGVPALSNCNSYHASFENHFVNVTAQHGGEAKTALNVFTGMRYQCVEYSRRFLASSTRLGRFVTFEPLDGAGDIFAVPNVSSVFDTEELYAFDGYANAEAGNGAPQFGDLLIYPVQGGNDNLPFGHVSVVNFVDWEAMAVAIGEQNSANAPWPVNSPCEDNNDTFQYARLLPFTYDNATNMFNITDPLGDSIQGWKRVGQRI